MLPEFIKYTNYNNSEWIINCSLTKYPLYPYILINTLIKNNIDLEFDYYKLIDYLIVLTNGNKSIFNLDFINYYVNKNITMLDINELFNNIKYGKPDLVIYYIKKLNDNNKLNKDIVKSFYLKLEKVDSFNKYTILNECKDIFTSVLEVSLKIYQEYNNSNLASDIYNNVVNNIDDIINNCSFKNLLIIKDIVSNNKEVLEKVDDKLFELTKENILNDNIFELRKKVINIKKCSDYITEFMDENNIKIIKDIYLSILHIEEKELKKEDIVNINVLYEIINEIKEYENISFHDVEYLGVGGYNFVLGIGDKVIKISCDRKTKTFPNNPYIVAPLFRKEFNNLRNLFIEVTERVEILDGDSITNDDLYNLYKSLRDMGIYWLDVHKTNVGRLIKDNKVYWNKSINTSDESLLLDKKIGSEVLNAGSLVLLDADFLYTYDNLPQYYFDTKYETYSVSKDFEQRYRLENGITLSKK